MIAPVTNKPVVYVAAAIIIADGKILLSKRPEGKELAGSWELPGGKIEQGELPNYALARELFEELNMQVSSKDMESFDFVVHEYMKFNLVMLIFKVNSWQGVIYGKEGQDIAWYELNKINELYTPPADEHIFNILSRGVIK